MRFSTIISALAVATSVTAAAGTSNLQPSLDSLNLDITALHDLTGLVSATVIEDLEHNLRDFSQKVHDAATVAMGELRREIEDLIADISGIITEIINFVKDNLGNSQDVNRACRSLNNPVAVMTDGINHVLDQVPENQSIGDLGAAISSLEESLDTLVSLMFSTSSSSCQTPPDMQHLRAALQRAKDMQ